jgi:hypothetical protein
MEHDEIEKDVNNPSIPGDSLHISYSIKTETGGDVHTADVGDDGLHCIKTERDSCLGIADVNNPTGTETAAMEFVNKANFDNRTISCINTEEANIADVDEHQLQFIKREPAQLGEQPFHCIKTEAANLTDISEHTFHCMKSEYSGTNGDGNNQTNVEATRIGYDTKSSVFCLKPELQDDHALQKYSTYTSEISQSEATSTESTQVVMGSCIRLIHITTFTSRCMTTS